MAKTVPPFETARMLASLATTEPLKALFTACATEWSHNGEVLTRRAVKQTLIGRALLDLMDAGDPGDDAYWEGYRDASEAAQARMAFYRQECDLSDLEHSDVRLWTHRANACVGESCTIHRRSDHSMRSFPQVWRGDRGFMERVCPHDVGHPDPDEAWVWENADAGHVHGCDGCCAGAYGDDQ